jgi:hypothetical protein
VTTDRWKVKYSDKNLSHYDFYREKLHNDFFGIETILSLGEAGV